ncbi:hydroxypyruvate isomerase family protein [Mycobacterium sp. NPDC003449]
MQPRRSFVANCSILYPTVPLLDQPAAAAADGYRQLEFWWPFDTSTPDEATVSGFVDAVGTSGTRVFAMNFTLGGTESGGRGIVSHPDRAEEFAAHLEAVAGIVTRLGIRRCNVPFGVYLPQYTAEEQLATAIGNLGATSDRLRRVSAVPMLEPLSGVQNYPVVTAEQAAQVISRVEEAVGRPGAVGLLADLYHLAANGEDIETVLRTHAERIAHVQIADFPGRHAPGTGTLDIDGYLRLLDELGYRGEVALEYLPVS